MVGAHATLADATKWKRIKGAMKDNIIDAQGTTACLSEESFHQLWVIIRKEIQCQWLGSSIDKGQCFVGILHRQYGQDWSKYFLLHDGIFWVNVYENGRRNVQLLRIGDTAVVRLAATTLQ